MFYKWLLTSLIVLLVMVIYWYEPLEDILVQDRIPDILMFIGLWVISTVIGILGALIGNRLSNGGLKSFWSFSIVSVFVSLLFLLIVSNKLIEIMMLT